MIEEKTTIKFRKRKRTLTDKVLFSFLVKSILQLCVSLKSKLYDSEMLKYKLPALENENIDID